MDSPCCQHLPLRFRSWCPIAWENLTYLPYFCPPSLSPNCMLSFYTNKQRVQKPKITTFILLMCLLLSSSLSGAKFYNGNDGETCTTLFCVLRAKMASLSLDLLKVSEVRLLYLSYPCTRCCTNPRPKPGDFFWNSYTSFAGRARGLCESWCSAINGIWNAWLNLISFSRRGWIDPQSIFNKTTCLCGLPTTRALLPSPPTPMNTLVNGTAEHPVPRLQTESSLGACNHILHTRPRKYISERHSGWKSFHIFCIFAKNSNQN